MRKKGQESLEQVGVATPRVSARVETVGKAVVELCDQLRSKMANLALPSLLTLGLSSACAPVPTAPTGLTIAPQMTTEVQQPGAQVFAELLMYPGSPFKEITVQSSVRPKDRAFVLGGFIIPTQSEQAIMVNVTSDKPASEGFYVFSEKKGPLSYQINVDKKLFNWINTTPYDFVLHVEQSIDQQGIRTDTYNPRYIAKITVRINKRGDFQTKSAGDIVLRPEKATAVAEQRHDDD